MKIKELKKKNKSEIWVLFKKILGVIFIIIGITGLFLPVIQGILLILIGLALFHDTSIKKYISDWVKKRKKMKKQKK